LKPQLRDQLIGIDSEESLDLIEKQNFFYLVFFNDTNLTIKFEDFYENSNDYEIFCGVSLLIILCFNI
jgi:hypothetical protein